MYNSALPQGTVIGDSALINASPLANTPLQTALDWLVRINDDPHNTQLQSELQQWQSQSTEYALAWQQAQQLWQLTAHVPARRLQHISPQRRSQRRARRWLAPALAACLILGLGLGLTGPLNNADLQKSAQSLADGSQITLNHSTQFAVDFKPDLRHLKLSQGEAYFEIASNPKRPFVIDAGDSQVQVTGTAFEVQNNPDYLSVSVSAGHVQVQTPNSPQARQLIAGQRLRYDRRQQLLSIEPYPVQQVALWREGLLVADDESLASLVQRLDRQQSGITLIRDPQLAERRITGVFHSQQPAAALQAMLEPLPAKLSHYGPWLRVVERATP